MGAGQIGPLPIRPSANQRPKKSALGKSAPFDIHAEDYIMPPPPPTCGHQREHWENYYYD